MYEPGDIVKVKNAKNGVGVYQIITSYLSHDSYHTEYKVSVLDIDRDTLPKVKDSDWSVTPSRYLSMAKKNPELYKLARFQRYNTTTKMSYNITGKLPFTPEQVIA